jgi:hypothetical protein
MRSFLDAKLMAKALRQSLVERGYYDLTYSDCLELVAHQFGFAEWNILTARIDAARAQATSLPEGWHRTGPGDASHHQIGLDSSEPGTVRIGSTPGIDVPSDKFSTLVQRILADGYRGQKLRLTAQLRGEDAYCGTIWMRIDPPDGRYLRFDNMMLRKSNGALKGTFGWTERSIVLDVPDNAATIHYGFFLQGNGKLWARGFRLDIADPESTVTGEPPFLPQPTNLDFGMPANG